MDFDKNSNNKSFFRYSGFKRSHHNIFRCSIRFDQCTKQNEKKELIENRDANIIRKPNIVKETNDFELLNMNLNLNLNSRDAKELKIEKNLNININSNSNRKKEENKAKDKDKSKAKAKAKANKSRINLEMKIIRLKNVRNMPNDLKMNLNKDYIARLSKHSNYFEQDSKNLINPKNSINSKNSKNSINSKTLILNPHNCTFYRIDNCNLNKMSNKKNETNLDLYGNNISNINDFNDLNNFNDFKNSKNSKNLKNLKNVNKVNKVNNANNSKNSNNIMQGANQLPKNSTKMKFRNHLNSSQRNVSRIILRDSFNNTQEIRKENTQNHGNSVNHENFEKLENHENHENLEDLDKNIIPTFQRNQRNSIILSQRSRSHCRNNSINSRSSLAGTNVISIKEIEEPQTLFKNLNEENNPNELYSPPTNELMSFLSKLKITDYTPSVNGIEDYIIGKIIGKGSYASVHIAINKISKKKVALKVYEKAKINTCQRVKSLINEIKILSKINHPNIVKLYEVFETKSKVVLALEPIEGQSLLNLLKSKPNRKLEESECRKIFKDIVVAITYCHLSGIAHRDLKLENILLDDEKNIKIIDFGFSTCFENENQKTKIYCGTHSYMAPEIISKIEYLGKPVDIWALGILLYALNCGRFPFKGKDAQELSYKILFENSEIPEEVPKIFKELISKMLLRDPEKRLTSVQVYIIRSLIY